MLGSLVKSTSRRRKKIAEHLSWASSSFDMRLARLGASPSKSARRNFMSNRRPASQPKAQARRVITASLTRLKRGRRRGQATGGDKWSGLNSVTVKETPRRGESIAAIKAAAMLPYRENVSTSAKIEMKAKAARYHLEIAGASA